MEKSQILDKITKAFPVEPVPTEREILYNEEDTYLGSFPVDEELSEIKSFFGIRPWTSVSPQDVFRFRHALSFFSLRALRYYTAAWINSSLLEEEMVDTGVEDLVGIVMKKDRAFWTNEQRLVLCYWLEYFKNVISERFSSNKKLSSSLIRDYEKAMNILECPI